ncbi:hypothetical protein BH11ARM1_BH11ARM1_11210 [soil metagenome]
MIWHANIFLLTPEEGGRITPILFGYRPAIYFQGDKSQWSMYIHTMEPKVIDPGGSGRISFELVSEEGPADRLTVGKEFQIHEGTRVVANAVILAVDM